MVTKALLLSMSAEEYSLIDCENTDSLSQKFVIIIRKNVPHTKLGLHMPLLKTGGSGNIISNSRERSIGHRPSCICIRTCCDNALTLKILGNPLHVQSERGRKGARNHERGGARCLAGAICRRPFPNYHHSSSYYCLAWPRGARCVR